MKSVWQEHHGKRSPPAVCQWTVDRFPDHSLLSPPRCQQESLSKHTHTHTHTHTHRHTHTHTDTHTHRHRHRHTHTQTHTQIHTHTHTHSHIILTCPTAALYSNIWTELWEGFWLTYRCHADAPCRTACSRTPAGWCGSRADADGQGRHEGWQMRTDATFMKHLINKGGGGTGMLSVLSSACW